MNNAINNQFKMKMGSKQKDTEGSFNEKEYEQELKREKRMPGFAEKPEGGIKIVAAENRRKAIDKISKPKAKVKIKK